jgi:phthiocerol/phenolphthiocerol synthesis type-I polyketide synthase B
MTATFHEAPVVPDSDPAVSTLVLFGSTPDRIASMAGVLAEWMTGEGAGVPLADVAHTLNHHRAWHRLFATVCARDCAQAVAGLGALAAGRPARGVVGPHEGPCAPGIVFVYSGQGSQWTGMGRQLLADEPDFAMAVAELEPVFLRQVGFSLERVLAAGEPVTGTDRVQPVLMGLQLALTELWRAYGTIPQAVVGHSMGEVTAAVVAGALSVSEGLRLIAIRSRFMARLAGQGAMASLELGAAGARRVIAENPGVAVASFCSPRRTVVAGPPAQVDAVIAAVRRRNLLARRVNTDVAANTPQMDSIVAELRSALGDIVCSKQVVPLISTVTGSPSTAIFDADHWVANVRQPVRFRQAITIAAGDNATFIEVSPHPVLTRAIAETLGGAHHHSVGTLRRHGDDTLSFHTNVNATHSIYPPETPHPPEPHPVLPTLPPQQTPLSMRAVKARRGGSHARFHAVGRDRPDPCVR